jgi:hypothetical protein
MITRLGGIKASDVHIPAFGMMAGSAAPHTAVIARLDRAIQYPEMAVLH